MKKIFRICVILVLVLFVGLNLFLVNQKIKNNNAFNSRVVKQMQLKDFFKVFYENNVFLLNIDILNEIQSSSDQTFQVEDFQKKHKNGTANLISFGVFLKNFYKLKVVTFKFAIF
jgi:hypothetical protein